MTETVERTELIQPEPAEALGALLGIPVPDLNAGEGLPFTWHWLYLLDRPRTEDLGPDGHPARGTIPAPPGPGLRRMWAGGAIQSLGDLVCGELATRRTQVAQPVEKQGRTGRLTIVSVSHEISQRGEVKVKERQDLVYREGGDLTLPASPESAPAVPVTHDEWQIEVTSPLLFRYSALTYNGHRIHYDRDYARDVEGYPGLLTHGPLQALAMAETARASGLEATPGAVFEYRLISPLFDFQGLVARSERDGDRAETSVRDLWGRQTARGHVVTES